MNAYTKYKNWWIAHEAQYHIGNEFHEDSAEECFRTHITQMSLYELMETLTFWENEDE